MTLSDVSAVRRRRRINTVPRLSLRHSFPLLHFICVLLVGLSSATAESPEKRHLRVACNVPLTGPLATYGTSIEEGVQFALAREHISDVDFDWQDNRSQPKEAVTAAKEQLLNAPDVYVSGVKPQYMAVHDIVSKAGIAHFPWVFDPNIRPKGEANFRLWVNFKIEAPLFISLAKARKPSRIAIVYVTLPHTDEEYREVVIPGLKAAGFADILVESYNLDLTDFQSLGTRVRAFNPDLIYLSGFQENLVAMVRAFLQLNLIHDGNAVASYDLLDAASTLAPSELEGIRVTTPKFILDQRSEPMKTWIHEFENQFRKKPNYTHAYAYDMAKVLHDATGRLPAGFSAKDVVAALAETHLSGISGSLEFDKDGDIPGTVSLGVYRNGEVVSEGY